MSKAITKHVLHIVVEYIFIREKSGRIDSFIFYKKSKMRKRNGTSGCLNNVIN